MTPDEQAAATAAAREVLAEPPMQREDHLDPDHVCDGCGREGVVALWCNEDHEPWLCGVCDKLAQREPLVARASLALAAERDALAGRLAVEEALDPYAAFKAYALAHGDDHDVHECDLCDQANAALASRPTGEAEPPTDLTGAGGDFVGKQAPGPAPVSPPVSVGEADSPTPELVCTQCGSHRGVLSDDDVDQMWTCDRCGAEWHVHDHLGFPHSAVPPSPEQETP